MSPFNSQLYRGLSKISSWGEAKVNVNVTSRGHQHGFLWLSSCPRTWTWSICDMDQNPSHSELHLTPRFPQLITEMILKLITEMLPTQSSGKERMQKMKERTWKFLMLSEHQQQLLKWNVGRFWFECVYFIYSIANRFILLYNERHIQDWNIISTDFQQ